MHRVHGGSLLRGLGHRPVPFPDAVGVVVRPVSGPAGPSLLGTRCRQGRRAHEAHGGSLLHGVLTGRSEPGSGVSGTHRDRFDSAGSVGRVRGARQRCGGRDVQAARGGREHRRLERGLAGGIGGRLPRGRLEPTGAGGRRSRRLASDDPAQGPRRPRRRVVGHRHEPPRSDAPAVGRLGRCRTEPRDRTGNGERSGPR